MLRSFWLPEKHREQPLLLSAYLTVRAARIGGSMEDRRLKTYFKLQIREMIRRSSPGPNGLMSFFAARKPKDEEILALLAISTMSSQSPLHGQFATPLEALAALSASSRAEICEAFRRRLVRRSVAGRSAVSDCRPAENLQGADQRLETDG